MAGFDNKYPYTDFHELNLDWFLAEFKKVTDKVTSLDATVQEFTAFVTNYFDNLDVQQEINNKLDQMVADGTLSALIQPLFDEYKEDIDAEIADQNEIINAQNEQITVLEGRMDEFSTLTEGSTTGDAELADIRVGANGVTYPNAGDAVRGQYTENRNSINDNLNLICDSYYSKRFNTTAGQSIFIPVNLNPGDIVKIENHTGGNTTCYTTNSSKVDVETIASPLENKRSINYELTQNAAYVRIFSASTGYINFYVRNSALNGLDNIISNDIYEIMLDKDFAVRESDTIYLDIDMNVGDSFTIINNNSEGAISAYTTNNLDATHDIQVITNGIQPGQSRTFSVSTDAKYMRVFSQKNGYIHVKKNNSIIQNIQNELNQPSLNFDINISDIIYAVTGDTIQIFYDSIINTPIKSGLKVNIKASVGTKEYPGFWQYTPGSNEAGTKTIYVQILDTTNTVVKEKQVSIVVKQPANPRSKKVVLCVGDSLIEQGQIPIEVSRRLKGTPGATSSPEALNLTNYYLLGRRTRYEGVVGFEGTSGYAWSNYISASTPAIRFTIADSSGIQLGDIFSLIDSVGTTQQFTVWGIDTVPGQHDLFCLYRGTPGITANIPASGTLTKVSGSGTVNSIAYSSKEVLTYSPFIDENGDFDFTTYVNTYCDGQLDGMYICLGTNDISRFSTSTDLHEVYDNAKIFIEALFDEFPNCKVFLSSLCKCGSHDTGQYYRQLRQQQVNNHYKKLASEYANVFYLDDNAVFDHLHAYNTGTVPVNTRSNITEVYDTDGTHPNNTGYWQRADSWFRTIINTI